MEQAQHNKLFTIENDKVIDVFEVQKRLNINTNVESVSNQYYYGIFGFSIY